MGKIFNDDDYKCPDTRCCRFCGKYSERLIKIGKRAYGHRACLRKRGRLQCSEAAISSQAQ